ALLHRECGDLTGALTAFARSVALFDTLPTAAPERGLLANALANQANALCEAGRPREARTVAARALLVAREGACPDREATALLSLGTALSGCGDRFGAQVALLDALRIAEEVGADRQIAGILGDIGTFYLNDGDLVAARPFLEEARERARE